jgi:hypothetical protein
MTDFAIWQRLRRVEAEVQQLLLPRYGAVRYDRMDATWVYIEQFPLGPGWSKFHVEILLDIPGGIPGYPYLPPKWVWMDRNLRTQDGRSIRHFFTSSEYADPHYVAKGWGHFCLYTNGWKPAPDHALMYGDSLATYLELIRVLFQGDRSYLGGLSAPRLRA